MQAQGKPVAAWTGAAGIEHYLETDSFDDAVQGRLIQSLKSHLSARNLAGTEIFGRQYQFEDLVARILRDLRLRASEFFGFEVTPCAFRQAGDVLWARMRKRRTRLPSSG